MIMSYVCSYYLGQNICRIFHVFVQFLLTTSDMELDFYHQKVDMRVASRVAQGLKTCDLRKLGHFKKIPEILRFDGEYPGGHPKEKF